MAETTTGTIILIIGTSSAGKSSMIRELQSLLPDHYLVLGIDTFFNMVSPRWGGGMGGPLSKDGFRYVTTTLDDHPYTRIAYGEVGNRVLQGMHRTVAALANCNNNIIVDEMLLDDTVLDDWVTVLQDYPVCVVRLHASLEVLEQREQHRRNPAGLSRGHLADNDIDVYDLDLDTTHATPTALAQSLVTYLTTTTEWTAIRQLAHRKTGR